VRQSLGLVSLVVRDYDEALEFFVGRLGFTLVEDTYIAKRYDDRDWWADFRNHAWQCYDGMVREDWPRLARHVADAVEAGTPVTDPALVRYFQRAARPGLLARLGRLLGLPREPA
jgi:catechol 2,3-dioxygenase-like lactoylglutathione lyase family enzyme